MAASFPESKKTFTQIVDGVTYVEAVNANTVYDEVEAIQTYLGASGEAQSKNSAVNNLYRDMFSPLPAISWIDAETIEIEAKQVVMFSGNDYVIKRNSSAIQIDLSSNLDTGAEANDTMYYVWLTGDGASTTYSAVFSTSDSAPSGYTYYKLIGAVKNDGSGDLLKFYQVKDWFFYDEEQSVLSAGNATTFTDIDCSGLIPSFARMGKFIGREGAANAESLFIRRNGSSASTGWHIDIFYGSGMFEALLDENQIFEYYGDSGCTWDIVVLGYSLSNI